jgi:hypothetical protein
MADTLLIPCRARVIEVVHTADAATKLSDRVRRRCFQYVEEK